MAENNSYLNPNYDKHLKDLKEESLEVLFEGIKKGDIASLSRGITLVESELPEHQNQASELLDLCLPFAGNSIRIGITGIPGAGKSTYLESLGEYVLIDDNKMAILAIDPSSAISKGSILGDKTRMEELSKHPQVFIRPTPTSGNLGGVSRTTAETIILCETAGFNIIMIETVGVGQSEIELYWLTDIFILLLIPGGGDELQGIKRGIMEVANMILVNKAEDSNKEVASQAVQELKKAIDYFPVNPYSGKTSVHAVSALKKDGIEESWKLINKKIQEWKELGNFSKKRTDQAGYWFRQTIQNGLLDLINKRSDWKEQYDELEKLVMDRKIHPFEAAEKMLQAVLNAKNP